MTVSKVRFRKEDSGWCILAVAGGKVAKGVVPFDVQEGMNLRLHGTWGVSQYNGEQEFSFVSVQVDIPDDAESLLHYACSQTKGLGPAKERRIWNAYGGDWAEHPDLEDIDGVTPDIVEAWQETLRNIRLHRDRTQAIAFLLSHDCTIKMAEAAWAEHNAAVIAKVTADPYCLSYLPRYGFSDIDDNIRRSFGVEDSDPRRLDAAVWYCMVTKCVADGSTVAEVVHLAQESEALVPSPDPANSHFPASVNRLIDAGRLVAISPTLVAIAKDAEAEREIFKYARAE